MSAVPGSTSYPPPPASLRMGRASGGRPWITLRLTPIQPPRGNGWAITWYDRYPAPLPATPAEEWPGLSSTPPICRHRLPLLVATPPVLRPMPCRSFSWNGRATAAIGSSTPVLDAPPTPGANQASNSFAGNAMYSSLASHEKRAASETDADCCHTPRLLKPDFLNVGCM